MCLLQELDYVKSAEAVDFVRRMGVIRPVPFESLFPTADTETIDLLRRMLELYPRRRITVQEAMDHSYFDAVRDMYSDADPELPEELEFEFEKDDDLTASDFRALIRAEAKGFKAEVEDRIRRRKARASSSKAGAKPASSSSS